MLQSAKITAHQGSDADTANGHFFINGYSVGVQTPKVPTLRTTVKFCLSTVMTTGMFSIK